MIFPNILRVLREKLNLSIYKEKKSIKDVHDVGFYVLKFSEISTRIFFEKVVYM